MTESFFENFRLHSLNFSWQRLFIGAKYRQIGLGRLLYLRIAISKITVFPDEVGAETIMFA